MPARDKPWQTHWKDYYKILQVDPSAEPEVIQAAYKRLALKYHPDKNKTPDATERMKKLNEAYGVLKDPAERAEYHKEWLRRNAASQGTASSSTPEPKPRPVVNPQNVFFQAVSPGEVKKSSFVISNAGGPYQRIWFSNPDSWVRIVGYGSVDPNQSDELPLRVEIEAEGQDWGQRHVEYIQVKLDQEVAQVRIELQTITEPKPPPRARPTSGSSKPGAAKSQSQRASARTRSSQYTSQSRATTSRTIPTGLPRGICMICSALLFVLLALIWHRYVYRLDPGDFLEWWIGLIDRIGEVADGMMPTQETGLIEGLCGGIGAILFLIVAGLAVLVGFIVVCLPVTIIGGILMFAERFFIISIIVGGVFGWYIGYPLTKRN